MIIDLDETTFVDSSILGVLVGGLRRARERDVPFGLVLGAEAHPAIRRIFELTGLHDVFPIYAISRGGPGRARRRRRLVTGRSADVSLVVPAVPDSIAVIRQTVSGICEALGADARAVGDIKLAATEACTNVVLHAYAGRDDGTIELDARAAADELQLLVRDHGNGMTPAPLAEGLGLGLPLIAALSKTMTIVEADGGGTEVSMTFALHDPPAEQ